MSTPAIHEAVDLQERAKLQARMAYVLTVIDNDRLKAITEFAERQEVEMWCEVLPDEYRASLKEALRCVAVFGVPSEGVEGVVQYARTIVRTLSPNKVTP